MSRLEIRVRDLLGEGVPREAWARVVESVGDLVVGRIVGVVRTGGEPHAVIRLVEENLRRVSELVRDLLDPPEPWADPGDGDGEWTREADWWKP